MQSKIILLNGPIGCGKTEAVKRIKAPPKYPVEDRRCKDHLFLLTYSFFCMSEEEFFEHYEDRETKETPKEEFSVSGEAYNELAPHVGKPTIHPLLLDREVMLSVREALIYVSEVVCKPAFGKEYFGVARAKSIKPNERAIDDSCGFDDEIAPTLDLLGVDNVLLIRIHGRGNFNGDSRNFISDGVVKNTIDLTNDADEESFLQEIARVSKKFYLT